jgi:hypothetical protein
MSRFRLLINLLLISLCSNSAFATTEASECIPLLRASTSLRNYHDQATDLNKFLEGFFRSNAYASSHPDFLTTAKFILHHAMHNTVQHGSKEMETSNFEMAQVNNSVEANISQNFVSIEISSPQIKSFPNALQREFFADDPVKVPNRQRRGYRGHGQAASAMIDSLSILPKGSSLKWEANGQVVRFTLKIKIP